MDFPAWVNAHRFGARVLRGGESPWQRPEQLGLYYKELQRWLSLELVDIDLAAALDDALGDPGDAAADDLIAVIEDRQQRERWQEGLAATLGAGLDVPVCLSLPGAARLASRLDDPDEDDLDDLALSLTNLLRALYTPELAAVLVHESDDGALDFYAPLANVAAHYQAPLMLACAGDCGPAPPGFARAYGPSGSSGGRYLAAADWPLPNGTGARPFYAEVPVAMTPDDVLAALRP